MRIIGYLLLGGPILWLIFGELTMALPKAGYLNSQLRALPVHEAYPRQEVKDLIWKIEAFHWSFPEQETYSRQEMTNILKTLIMKSSPARNDFERPIFLPILAMISGAFLVGLGEGLRRDAKVVAETK